MNDALAKAALLDELGEAGRETIAEFFEERTYQDGFLLYQQYMEASELLVIADGQVALRKGKKEIAALGAGDSLGGMSLVVIGCRECEAMANGRVDVLAMTRESYLRLRADYPNVAVELQEAILRDVAAAVRDILGDLTSTS